ncbi:MAG: lamin tail domain-containing protein, partial [Bacteroidia bacterium]|nr:lamin tail domain-containing protein [Bacteroidia bacterium]
LERIGITTACTGAANWRASVHPSGGTPGQVNSILNQFNDNTPPAILSADVPVNNQITITFSEGIILPAATNLANYQLTPSISIVSAVLSSDATAVTLTLSSPLAVGTIYQLQVSNQSDCVGNVMTSQTVTVGLPVPATVGDVIITELLPDPDPVVGLPNQEFVEIHNRSSNLISLNGWIFSDGSTNAVLGNRLLAPGEYLILTANANVSLYQSFGSVLGLSSLPSLNNSGDNLKLFDNNGTIIDSVNYSITWYQDPNKDDGGWTLERIGITTACTGAANWRASVHPSGGT